MSDNSNNNNKRNKQPSFLNRHLIDENTGISFTSPADAANVPEPTRRVTGPVSFGPSPALSSPLSPPSFGAAGPTVNALPSKEQTVATAAFAEGPAPVTSTPMMTTPMWRLASVPTLPEFHPLERTAVFVPHSANNPTGISSRIAEVLRDRSIEASFDTSKAKAKCVTAEGVDFRIRLYRGRNSYGHGIIVEVQRRFGSSLTFHEDTAAILDAALKKTGGPASPPPPRSSGTDSSALPLVSDSEATPDDDDSEASAVSSPNNGSALAVVASMLGHEARDSHYLAFQTLLPLTSSARMGRATAKSVSAQLLQPGNPVGGRVLELVLQKPQQQPPPSHAASRNEAKPKDILDDDTDSEGEEGGEEDAFHLRTLALQVLANAVSVTKGQTVSKELKIELWPVLVREIGASDTSPRHAQVAASIVEPLLGADGEGVGDDLLEALERAIEVGKTRHAGLKFQAQRCLDRIRRM